MLSPWFLEEASRWIAADTVTHKTNAALAGRAGRLLGSLGWETRRQRAVEGRAVFFNLLARRGPKAGRPLLLNTHTDTVPPGPPDRWTETGGDAFRLTRRGGFLYGLGVADVKLNLLCQIEALRRLGPISFRRPVAIAGTYGEERGLRGARRLIASWRGPKPALVLDGEPTEMAVMRRHRGYLVFAWDLPTGPSLRAAGRAEVFDVLVKGRSAHSSTPHLGVNALERAMDLLEALSRRGFSPRVLSASGGTAHNQVPAEARLTLLLPGWPDDLPLKDLEVRRRSARLRPARLLPWEVLARLKNGGLPRTHSMNWAVLEGRDGRWTARFDARFPPEDRPERLIARVRRALAGAGTVRVLLNDPPLDARARGPEVRFLTKVLRGAGLPATLGEKATCTEAGLFDAWGAPAVVIGPGRSTGNVHRPNERIALSQLERAVRFYHALFRAWNEGS